MSAKLISSSSASHHEEEVYKNGNSCSTAWIGVDLDGTLAQYIQGEELSEIGDPIEPMMARVRKWLAQGRVVKIFTARAAIPKQVEIIKVWLAENGLPDLEVTNTKDFGMIELWDDRCVQVNANTGMTMFDTVNSGDRMGSRVKVTRPRRRASRPVSKLLSAIERIASTWNQVPSREFQPAPWGRTREQNP